MNKHSITAAEEPAGNERHHLTQEALTDVDVGAVVDHQTVQVWADSLSTATTM